MIDRLYRQHRTSLFRLAYRITGSVADAEDIVQDAFIRFQKAGADRARAPKALLVTITARLALNQLRRRRREQRNYPGEWLPEFIETSATPPAESTAELSYGLLLMMENMNPVERTVFVLRSAFDSRYADIAEMIGAREDHCRQLFRRAKARIEPVVMAETAAGCQQGTLVEDLLNAISTSDANRIVQLFRAEAHLHGDGGGKVYALKRPLAGREAIARFLIASRRLLDPEAEYRPGILNGLPGAVFEVRGHSVMAIAVAARSGRIDAIYAIVNRDKLGSLDRVREGTHPRPAERPSPAP